MSLQIPIGDHLFTSDQLQKVLLETIPNLPPEKTGAIAASLDASGAKVGLIMTSKDGHWTVKTAYEHDWSGDNKIAGAIMASW